MMPTTSLLYEMTSEIEKAAHVEMHYRKLDAQKVDAGDRRLPGGNS